MSSKQGLDIFSLNLALSFEFSFSSVLSVLTLLHSKTSISIKKHTHRTGCLNRRKTPQHHINEIKKSVHFAEQPMRELPPTDPSQQVKRTDVHRHSRCSCRCRKGPINRSAAWTVALVSFRN